MVWSLPVEHAGLDHLRDRGGVSSPLTAGGWPSTISASLIVSGSSSPYSRGYSSAASLPPGVTADMPLNPATDTLIRHARRVADLRTQGKSRGRVDAVSDLDIVLGALDWLTDPDSDAPKVLGATASLVGMVGGPQARSQVFAAIDAAIATGSGGITMQPVSSLIGRATALAVEVGAREILPHHVVASALADEPLPPEALRIFGVTQDQLCRALSSAIRELHPAEPADFWLGLLERSPTPAEERAAEPDQLGPSRLDPAALAIMAWTTAVRDSRTRQPERRRLHRPGRGTGSARLGCRIPVQHIACL